MVAHISDWDTITTYEAILRRFLVIIKQQWIERRKIGFQFFFFLFLTIIIETTNTRQIPTILSFLNSVYDERVI